MKNKKFRLFIILFLFSVCLLGCSKKVGEVDYSKKLTLEQVKEYTKNEIKNKYGADIEITDVEVNEVYFCHGSIDGSCYNRHVIKGADRYLLKCVTNDGMEFNVVYIDAYKNTHDNIYNDVQFNERYKEIREDFLLTENIISKFRSVVGSYNVNAEIYRADSPYSSHDVVILVNKNDINKIDKITEEFGKVIEEYIEQDKDYLEYYLYVGDSNFLNEIKGVNARLGINELRKIYTFDRLYSKSNIDIRKYNEYINNNKYSNYVVLVEYKYSKRSGTNTNAIIYGVEKNTSNTTYNGYNY
jgi:hypothetical protein